MTRGDGTGGRSIYGEVRRPARAPAPRVAGPRQAAARARGARRATRAPLALPSPLARRPPTLTPPPADVCRRELRPAPRRARRAVDGQRGRAHQRVAVLPVLRALPLARRQARCAAAAHGRAAAPRLRAEAPPGARRRGGRGRGRGRARACGGERGPRRPAFSPPRTQTHTPHAHTHAHTHSRVWPRRGGHERGEAPGGRWLQERPPQPPRGHHRLRPGAPRAAPARPPPRARRGLTNAQPPTQLSISDPCHHPPSSPPPPGPQLAARLEANARIAAEKQELAALKTNPAAVDPDAESRARLEAIKQRKAGGGGGGGAPAGADAGEAEAAARPAKRARDGAQQQQQQQQQQEEEQEAQPGAAADAAAAGGSGGGEDGGGGGDPFEGLSARQRKLLELRQKLSQCRKANEHAVIAERKRMQVCSFCLLVWLLGVCAWGGRTRCAARRGGASWRGCGSARARAPPRSARRAAAARTRTTARPAPSASGTRSSRRRRRAPRRAAPRRAAPPGSAARRTPARRARAPRPPPTPALTPPPPRPPPSPPQAEDLQRLGLDPSKAYMLESAEVAEAKAKKNVRGGRRCPCCQGAACFWGAPAPLRPPGGPPPCLREAPTAGCRERAAGTSSPPPASAPRRRRRAPRLGGTRLTRPASTMRTRSAPTRSRCGAAPPPRGRRRRRRAALLGPARNGRRALPPTHPTYPPHHAPSPTRRPRGVPPPRHPSARPPPPPPTRHAYPHPTLTPPITQPSHYSPPPQIDPEEYRRLKAERPELADTTDPLQYGKAPEVRVCGGGGGGRRRRRGMLPVRALPSRCPLSPLQALGPSPIPPHSTRTHAHARKHTRTPPPAPPAARGGR